MTAEDVDVLIGELLERQARGETAIEPGSLWRRVIRCLDLLRALLEEIER